MTQTQGAGNPPRLIVGLGNPGAEYAKTRHNAGFWFCERLARQLGIALAPESRFHGLVGQARSEGIWLLSPQTFMNRSGQAVQALTHFYRIEPQQMLVVHDDLDLPPGGLRLRFGGGLGGHNGLKDITAHLSTQDYWRLRIGIGHPGERHEVINYVLKPPLKEEGAQIEEALERALPVWPWLARGDWATAMLKINTKPAPPAAAADSATSATSANATPAAPSAPPGAEPAAGRRRSERDAS